MLNKTLTLGAVFLYGLLLLLVGRQQAKVIPWDGSKLIRVSLSRADRPKRPPAPPPSPDPFTFSVPPVILNQQNWAQLRFLTEAGPVNLTLQTTQSGSGRTQLEFRGGAFVTFLLKEERTFFSFHWKKKHGAGELVLPFPLRPGYQWSREEDAFLLVNENERWLLSSEHMLNMRGGTLIVRLPSTGRGEMLSLFTLAPAPAAARAFSSDYASYEEQLHALSIERFFDSSSARDLGHYLAAHLRRGTQAKAMPSPATSYDLGPYLGLSAALLRQQVELDRRKSAELLLKTPEQILGLTSYPSTALFLFNHYQLDKLRQLLRYSLNNLASSPLPQKINRLLPISEILLINPVMVSAQGSLTEIDSIMRQTIIPAAEEWIGSDPPFSLRQQLKMIALLRHWSKYKDNSAGQALAEQLTLQLQQYQDETGTLSKGEEERVDLGELLDWVGSTEYRSMERSVTPGFWIQGISSVQTDYRPGYFIRIHSTFPSGKTQYLILRGIYFQPREVFFDRKLQPQQNWDAQLSSAQGNSWNYDRELKTLVIKATHPKKQLVIDIPY